MSTLFAAATLFALSLSASSPPYAAALQGKGPRITFETFAASHTDMAPARVKALWPLTVAESSDYTRSSTLAEVEAFLRQVQTLPSELSTGATIEASVFGTTTEGRSLTAVSVRLGEPRPDRVRVLINANIHGGEIEGKVAAQILVRELAAGYHHDLLEDVELTFVPVYNADGNDKIARTNRVTQNGPDGGVGERPNAAGLDLNRDFVKLESPEARALTTLIRELDPHAFMDLHTTNGSPHGYDLTYAPSLSPNVDFALAGYMSDRFFPAVRQVLAERDAIHTYDYGNFGYARRKRGSRGERGDPISWSTYDSRPRFGTNLMGLRGKVSILSEAYSYLPYERRIDATYAFVLECLRVLAQDQERVRALVGGALEPNGGQPVRQLGVGARLDSIGNVPVRVGHYDEVTIDLEPGTEGVQGGSRRVSAGPAAVRTVSMDVKSRFRATRAVGFTQEFLVLGPSPELIATLEVHLGADAVVRVPAGGAAFHADVFVVEEAIRSQRVFQGHREARVRGRWVARDIVAPAGSLRIASSILVAHLLHPESDDSLTTWNYFDEALFPATVQGDFPGAAGREGERPRHNPDVPLTHPVVMIR